MKELKRYFSYIGKYKTAYWTVFLFTLVSSAVLTFAYPYMNKLIFNALEYEDIKIFQRAVVLCIVLVVLNCLAPYRRYFQIKIVRKIVFDINNINCRYTAWTCYLRKSHEDGDCLLYTSPSPRD